MRGLSAAIVLVILISAVAFPAVSQIYDRFPGLVFPSGCPVGAVLSLEQFTSVGFSSVRTASPYNINFYCS